MAGQHVTVNRAAARELAIASEHGGLVFANFEQVDIVAFAMAEGGVSVPGHLRGQPGVCRAVILQAIEWKMSPFAVANKSYMVNNRLAFEAQLIAAIILQRGPLAGRPKYDFTGEGATLRCRVIAKTKDGEELDYRSPELGKIPVKNSPLWKADPEQQLGYYSVRALARRHFPDVILGIYEREELAFSPPEPRDVTPKPPAGISAKLDAIAKPRPAAETVAEVIDVMTGEILEGDDSAAGEKVDERPPLNHVDEDPPTEEPEPTGYAEGAADEPEPGRNDAAALAYIARVRAIIDGAGSAEQLKTWWNADRQKLQRRELLTVDEANVLKAEVIERCHGLSSNATSDVV